MLAVVGRRHFLSLRIIEITQLQQQASANRDRCRIAPAICRVQSQHDFSAQPGKGARKSRRYFANHWMACRLLWNKQAQVTLSKVEASHGIVCTGVRSLLADGPGGGCGRSEERPSQRRDERAAGRTGGVGRTRYGSTQRFLDFAPPDVWSGTLLRGNV